MRLDWMDGRTEDLTDKVTNREALCPKMCVWRVWMHIHIYLYFPPNSIVYRDPLIFSANNTKNPVKYYNRMKPLLAWGGGAPGLLQ